MSLNNQNITTQTTYFQPKPFTKWTIAIVLLLALAIILDQGIAFWSTNFASMMNPNFHLVDNPVDPLWEVYIQAQPIIPKLMSVLYPTPFYHLLFGIILKLLLVITYFLIVKKITGSTLASSIAVCLLFGVAYLKLGNYQIFNFRFPTGFSSNEFRLPNYLSFRQVAMFCTLISVLFFLTRRFFLCALFSGMGVHSHSQNSINFFICFCTALLLCCIFKNRKKEYFNGFILISITFFVIISPFVLSVIGMLENVEPLEYSIFWKFLVQSEADDVTILYYLQNKKAALATWFISALSGAILHVVLTVEKPILWNKFKAQAKEENDMLLPLLLAPVVLTVFGLIWESFLIPYLPDFLNDQINRLCLRRVGTVSSIIYMAIFGALFAKIVLILFEKVCLELFPVHSVESVGKNLKKLKLNSSDTIISLLVAGLVLFNVLFINKRNSEFSNITGIQTFKKYMVFEPVDYAFFRSVGIWWDRPVYQSAQSSDAMVIPFQPFLDVCRWIRDNTKKTSAFINPTYIREFRSCTERQGFLAVKVDGLIAPFDRRFAAIYLKRFLDIHKGLRVHNLPELANDKFQAYRLIRSKYLSLNKHRIEEIKQIYPGYEFFLTESSHKLPYPVIYSNSHFILYNIK